MAEEVQQAAPRAKAGPRAASRKTPANMEAILAEAKAALSKMSDVAKGNAAIKALSAAAAAEGRKSGNVHTLSQLLLARGLLFWRWSMLDRALQDLTEAYDSDASSAAPALLALHICLSQWTTARCLAKELSDSEATSLIEQWSLAARSSQSNLFFAQAADFVSKETKVADCYRQADVHIEAAEGASLGVRLLLCVDEASSATAAQPAKGPLVLCFHGEDENVDSYLAPGFLEPFRSAGASLVVAGFRGYGCSTGDASLEHLRADGDRICDALPEVLAEKGLPWPWPGRLVLYGNSLGSRVACYLAGVRGPQLFDGGVVLESAWCGSFAPGARPLPEPPKHMALAAMGSNQVGDGGRFGSKELLLASGALSRHCVSLLQGAGRPGSSHFCHMRGNEDLIRGFGGRLLLLHGELDHVVPAEHARRLCDAAEAATRRLVLIAGKRFDSLRSGVEYQQSLRKFLEGCRK